MTEFQKHDQGKAPYCYIPFEKRNVRLLTKDWSESILDGVAWALEFGAYKYGQANHRLAVFDPDLKNRYTSAFYRHLFPWYKIVECASDSQIPHVYHALANLVLMADIGPLDDAYLDKLKAMEGVFWAACSRGPMTLMEPRRSTTLDAITQPKEPINEAL